MFCDVQQRHSDLFFTFTVYQKSNNRWIKNHPAEMRTWNSDVPVCWTRSNWNEMKYTNTLFDFVPLARMPKTLKKPTCGNSEMATRQQRTIKGVLYLRQARAETRKIWNGLRQNSSAQRSGVRSRKPYGPFSPASTPLQVTKHGACGSASNPASATCVEIQTRPRQRHLLLFSEARIPRTGPGSGSARKASPKTRSRRELEIRVFSKR